ncbi:MAG: hypothetical protein U0411_09920 [Thermodesulfovibrionales bacterium]
MKKKSSPPGRARKGAQTAALSLLLLAMGCSSTFIITKEGKGYYFGSTAARLYTMLCSSGDLRAILDDAGLHSATKDALYRYNCEPAERSKEKVREIYAALSPEQRRELRLAFQKHGYDINYLEC